MHECAACYARDSGQPAFTMYKLAIPMKGGKAVYVRDSVVEQQPTNKPPVIKLEKKTWNIGDRVYICTTCYSRDENRDFKTGMIHHVLYRNLEPEVDYITVH